ncbi:MAG: choline/ethanolamine kinase family protein [Pseudomonadota bacterium]
MNDAQMSQLVPFWAGQKVEWTSLGGGFTNQSFCAVVDDTKFVVRVNNAALGLDRTFERKVLWFAQAAGVGPRVAFASADVLVCHWIDGGSFTQEGIRQIDVVKRVAKFLRRVHSWPIPGHRLSVADIAHGYLRKIRKPTQEHQSLLREVTRAAEELENLSRPRCLCHNDPSYGNWIEADNLILLDWEYAGVGDPLFDLAMFSYYHTLSFDAVKLLLQEYLGEVGPTDIRAFELNLILVRALCVLWWAMMEPHKPKDSM